MNAVVTPIGPTILPAHFKECVRSVQLIDAKPRHILVFDGPGSCSDLEIPHNAIRVDLPRNVRDIGSTPRTIGAAYAWGLGATTVSFLDADCLVRNDHLKLAYRHHEATGKPVICSGREIMHWDGTQRAPCPEMIPKDGKFFDTNTFTFFRDAIGLSYSFGTLTGYEQHKVGDRILSERAQPVIGCHYHPSIIYRTAHEFHYKTFGWTRPAGVKIKNLANDENTR